MSQAVNEGQMTEGTLLEIRDSVIRLETQMKVVIEQTQKTNGYVGEDRLAIRALQSSHEACQGRCAECRQLVSEHQDYITSHRKENQFVVRSVEELNKLKEQAKGAQWATALLSGVIGALIVSITAIVAHAMKLI